MFGVEATFELDQRLAQDSHLLRSHDAWQVRLLDDSRWPWLLIVPTRAGLNDMDDLSSDLVGSLFNEAAHQSAILKSMAARQGNPLDKTNVATIGNIVRQFHIHVVGRREGDPGWPGPVWGHGTREPYTAAAFDAFKAAWEAA